jgi:hypothetical protein
MRQGCAAAVPGSKRPVTDPDPLGWSLTSQDCSGERLMAASEGWRRSVRCCDEDLLLGLSDLGHVELEVLGRTDRYHQYRRPPIGRPVAPRIHKTAPITNKMIPSVVRIPMPVSHPIRSRTNPRMSTRLPPQ